MGKIVKRLKVVGGDGVEELAVLMDSGASVSLVRRDRAIQAGAPLYKRPSARVFHMANGDEGFRSDEVCILDFEMKGKVLDGLFYVVDQMPREVIIGVDFMQRWEIRLDMKAEDYEVGVDPEAIEIA